MSSARTTTRERTRAAAEWYARGEDAPAMSLVADQMKKHAARVRCEADQIIAALLDGLPESERGAILAHAASSRKRAPERAAD